MLRRCCRSATWHTCLRHAFACHGSYTHSAAFCGLLPGPCYLDNLLLPAWVLLNMPTHTTCPHTTAHTPPTHTHHTHTSHAVSLLHLVLHAGMLLPCSSPPHNLACACAHAVACTAAAVTLPACRDALAPCTCAPVLRYLGVDSARFHGFSLCLPVPRSLLPVPWVQFWDLQLIGLLCTAHLPRPGFLPYHCLDAPTLLLHCPHPAITVPACLPASHACTGTILPATTCLPFLPVGYCPYTPPLFHLPAALDSFAGCCTAVDLLHLLRILPLPTPHCCCLPPACTLYACYPLLPRYHLPARAVPPHYLPLPTPAGGPPPLPAYCHHLLDLDYPPALWIPSPVWMLPGTCPATCRSAHLRCSGSLESSPVLEKRRKRKRKKEKKKESSHHLPDLSPLSLFPCAPATPPLPATCHLPPCTRLPAPQCLSLPACHLPCRHLPACLVLLGPCLLPAAPAAGACTAPAPRTCHLHACTTCRLPRLHTPATTTCTTCCLLVYSAFYLRSTAAPAPPAAPRSAGQCHRLPPADIPPACGWSAAPACRPPQPACNLRFCTLLLPAAALCTARLHGWCACRATTTLPVQQPHLPGVPLLGCCPWPRLPPATCHCGLPAMHCHAACLPVPSSAYTAYCLLACLYRVPGLPACRRWSTPAAAAAPFCRASIPPLPFLLTRAAPRLLHHTTLPACRALLLYCTCLPPACVPGIHMPACHTLPACSLHACLSATPPPPPPLTWIGSHVCTCLAC